MKQLAALKDKSLALIISSAYATSHGGNIQDALPKQIDRPAQVDPKFSEIGGVITTVINAGIILAAIIAFIFLVWGGIQWITSGGDKQGLEDARNRITNAIVGLVIVAAAWAIFQLVQLILVGDILDLQPA